MVNVPAGMFHPSRETKRVLKPFQEKGNYIVVATARTQIPDSVRDIDFDRYICSDGHYIEFRNEVLVNNIFSNEEIKMQIQIYNEHNGHCALGGYSGSWVSPHTDPYLKKHYAIYSGTDNLIVIPLVPECKGKILASSIAAVFGSAEDLFAAKDKLPDNWAINAYGDGANDIEMLQLVGHGIAMGNASDMVKERAHYVTNTVNN